MASIIIHARLYACSSAHIKREKKKKKENQLWFTLFTSVFQLLQGYNSESWDTSTFQCFFFQFHGCYWNLRTRKRWIMVLSSSVTFTTKGLVNKWSKRKQAIYSQVFVQSILIYNWRKIYKCLSHLHFKYIYEHLIYNSVIFLASGLECRGGKTLVLIKPWTSDRELLWDIHCSTPTLLAVFAHWCRNICLACD